MHRPPFVVATFALLLACCTAAATASSYNYETKFISQFVDHYSLASNQTFQQKYLVNTEFWCGNGCPILFFCGHDGRDGHIEMFANENTGWMWDYGKQLEAMLVFAEHRYYGDSRPHQVDENKPAHEQLAQLGYLTSQQALGDYAKLVYAIKHNIYKAPDSPVLALGGGYGGILAAWMRMKYPNAVIGAWASSAPMYQFENWVDCRLLSQLTTREYAAVSENCKGTIAKSWASVMNIVSNPEQGLPVLSSLFNTCLPLAHQDIPNLFETLGHIWYFLLMSDYPNESHYYKKLPARPLKQVCKILDTDPNTLTDAQLVERISKAVHFFMDYNNQDACFDLNVPLFPKFLFEFQANLEFVLPHCSDGVNDMFINYPYELGLLSQRCKMLYGTEPRLGAIGALYHGEDLSAYSKILFTLPTRDPYYVTSHQESLPGNSIYSWDVEGATWMEELRASAVNDSDHVSATRQRVTDLLNSWIKDYNSSRSKRLDSSGRSDL